MRNSNDSQRNKETKWYNLKQSSDNSTVWDKKNRDKSCKLFPTRPTLKALQFNILRQKKTSVIETEGTGERESELVRE